MGVLRVYGPGKRQQEGGDRGAGDLGLLLPRRASRQQPRGLQVRDPGPGPHPAPAPGTTGDWSPTHSKLEKTLPFVIQLQVPLAYLQRPYPFV